MKRASLPARRGAVTRPVQKTAAPSAIAARTAAARRHGLLETVVTGGAVVTGTAGALVASSAARTVCEWKGEATYYDVVGGDARRVTRAAWTYHAPRPGYEAIRDAVAFYPAAMDECTLDGEVVQPQPGGFYGGWITADLVGPFKGGPGTAAW